MNDQLEKIFWAVWVILLCQAIQVAVLFCSYSKQLESRYELYRIAKILERMEN